MYITYNAYIQHWKHTILIQHKTQTISVYNIQHIQYLYNIQQPYLINHIKHTLLIQNTTHSVIIDQVNSTANKLNQLKNIYTEIRKKRQKHTKTHKSRHFYDMGIK